MRPASRKLLLVRRLILLLLIVASLVLTYRIIATELAIRRSGLLVVSSPAPSTSLTVTQGNHTAVYIGSGTARVRLQPGQYLVGAKILGEQTTETAAITKGHTTNISLNPAKADKSAAAKTAPTGFINFDVLVSHGLDSEVETYVEQLFSTYNQTARIVSVDVDSITVLATDSNSDSTIATINFSGTIDSIPFKATVQYDPYDNTTLNVYDPSTGALLFAGSEPPQGT